MHDIEPYFKWRDLYIASEDEASPFYGRVYNEFTFHNKVYNYFIHPQWDEIGSSTLYIKVLYANYELGLAIIEGIGEWNDCIHNDVMFLKDNILNKMVQEGLNKFIFICENVLNFHGSDDCYYEELYQDISEEQGWVVFLNTLEHVKNEMNETGLQSFVYYGPQYNDPNWRSYKPINLYQLVEQMIAQRTKELPY